MSPALSYTSKHLHNDVEKEKKKKLPKEFEEDKIKREEEKRGTLKHFEQCVYVSNIKPCLNQDVFISQRLRRGRTLLAAHGRFSVRTARTAASRTACTTWETTSTWSLLSQTSSHTLFTLNVSGKMTPVSLSSYQIKGKFKH